MKLKISNIGSNVKFIYSVTYQRIYGDYDLKGFRNKLIIYLR
jgi:hypothetical protein